MIRMLLSERDQVVHASRERAEEPMSDLKRLLLDLFFPPRCQGCGRSGTSLCTDCKAKLPVIPYPRCARCSRHTGGVQICAHCYRHSGEGYISTPSSPTTISRAHCGRWSTSSSTVARGAWPSLLRFCCTSTSRRAVGRRK